VGGAFIPVCLLSSHNIHIQTTTPQTWTHTHEPDIINKDKPRSGASAQAKRVSHAKRTHNKQQRVRNQPRSTTQRTTDVSLVSAQDRRHSRSSSWSWSRWRPLALEPCAGM